MHGQGLKSRPPSLDTMKDDSSSTSPTIKLRCYNRGGGSSYAIVQHYCHTKRHSREIVGAQLVERSWVLEKVTGREIISWTVDLWNCSRRISGASTTVCRPTCTVVCWTWTWGGGSRIARRPRAYRWKMSPKDWHFQTYIYPLYNAAFLDLYLKWNTLKFETSIHMPFQFFRGNLLLSYLRWD
jgi:hypothetical protein